MALLSPDMPRHRVGLALSGGGVRAIAFHSGVLRWFAERELLEQIDHISSVSGGSLFTGLVFRFSGYSWPTSAQYVDHVLPQIRNLLTSKSLQINAVFRLLLNPLNWRFLLSRANVIAQSIEHLWGVSTTLGHLPQRPVWSINGTTAENGRRFRFKGMKIGDYESGYADAENYRLASAMAVSAAFPGGIGPLTLDTTHYKWLKQKRWDSTQPAEVVKPEFKKLHLYDGGVYDNLGMEPLFDVGKQAVKNSVSSPFIDFVVVSDAGASFARRTIPGPLRPSRLKRVADVAFDQARALRVRAFVNFLQSHEEAGMYLQIGSNPTAEIATYSSKNPDISLIVAHDWLPAIKTRQAASYKTSLLRMESNDFDLIERHGYETALWNEMVFFGNKLKTGDDQQRTEKAVT
jgi:NTE family protein